MSDRLPNASHAALFASPAVHTKSATQFLFFLSCPSEIDTPQSGRTPSGRTADSYSLYVYPVKSCDGIAQSRVRLTRFGLAWDRCWMVIDRDGRFVSQREYPDMACVTPALTVGNLQLCAPGMPTAVHCSGLALGPASLVHHDLEGQCGRPRRRGDNCAVVFGGDRGVGAPGPFRRCRRAACQSTMDGAGRCIPGPSTRLRGHVIRDGRVSRLIRWLSIEPIAWLTVA